MQEPAAAAAAAAVATDIDATEFCGKSELFIAKAIPAYQEFSQYNAFFYEV